MSQADVPLVSTLCHECGAPVEFPVGSMQVRCGHCDAGMAIGQDARLVRLDCPRCKGNFHYIDGSMCARCPYCDANLLALAQDRLLRYVIPPAAQRPELVPQDATLHFLPFWQLSGLVYGFDIGSKLEVIQDDPSYDATAENEDYVAPTTTRNSGPQKVFKGRVVNVSLPDPATLAWGVSSLRFRASVHPLEPFKVEHESLGQMVAPTTPLDTVQEQLRGRAMTKGHVGGEVTRLDCQRQDLLAESFSLIYYPFWIKPDTQGRPVLWDGVNGEVEPLCAPGPTPALGSSTVFDELKIIELTCKACGDPLPVGTHAVVFSCAQCGQFWHLTRDGLQEFEARHAAPQVPVQGKTLWLPFWRVPNQVSYGGKVAQKVGDMITVLGITRPRSDAPTAPADAPLVFYAPAYGALQLPRLDFAARDMTRLQPVVTPHPNVGPKAPGQKFSCFYDGRDGQRLAYVSWIRVLPGTVVPRLRSLRITTGQPELWYVPFEDHDRELVNLLTGFRYDRAVFRGVGH